LFRGFVPPEANHWLVVSCHPNEGKRVLARIMVDELVQHMLSHDMVDTVDLCCSQYRNYHMQPEPKVLPKAGGQAETEIYYVRSWGCFPTWAQTM
jgi:hypothetical protein